MDFQLIGLWILAGGVFNIFFPGVIESAPYDNMKEMASIEVSIVMIVFGLIMFAVGSRDRG